MELTRVRLETTVEDALFRAKFDLLPEEMATDWRGEGVTQIEQFKKKRKNRMDGGKFLRPTEGRGGVIITPIFTNALTPKISFYFASLFHIGRQWQVGQYAAETAQHALVPEYLRKTAELHLPAFATETDAGAEGISMGEQRQFLMDSLREV